MEHDFNNSKAMSKWNVLLFVKALKPLINIRILINKALLLFQNCVSLFITDFSS